MSSLLNERLSLAPMVEVTDAHFRYFLRGLSKKTVLYTEMIVDDTITRTISKLDFLVGKNIEENPSVIQLGGHDAEMLANAAEICSQYGDYNEINLNCGCPSQRVSKRCFGAKLMEEPDYVREIVQQMQRRSSKPITIKCRIGVDNKDSYEELCHFIQQTHLGGVQKFVIHSRKCFLKGLSTKQNRDVPPLKYDIVHRLVHDFPDLTFILNGGIMNFEEAKSHFQSPWIPSSLTDCESIQQNINTNSTNKKSKYFHSQEISNNTIINTDNTASTHVKHNFTNNTASTSIVKLYSLNSTTNQLIQSFNTGHIQSINNHHRVASEDTNVARIQPDYTNVSDTIYDNTSSINNTPLLIDNKRLHSEDKTFSYSPVHGIMIGRAFHSTPLMLR